MLYHSRNCTILKCKIKKRLGRNDSNFHFYNLTLISAYRTLISIGNKFLHIHVVKYSYQGHQQDNKKRTLNRKYRTCTYFYICIEIYFVFKEVGTLISMIYLTETLIELFLPFWIAGTNYEKHKTPKNVIM